VILCNADQNGVLFNSELAQILIRKMNFSGVDFSKFQSQFTFENIKKEQAVNLGYKNLIFDAFIAQLPEEILNRKEKFKFAGYNLLTSAQILKVSNEKFARGENLTSDYEPVFDPILFGSQGKIMDSWETVRHNSAEFDFIRFKLKKSENIKYIFISTKYHDGNQVPLVSVHGKSTQDANWIEILPQFAMNGHSYVYLQLVKSVESVQFVEIRAYPDGGLTRLGLFSEIPESEKQNFQLLDLKNPPHSIRHSETIPQVHKSLGLKKEQYQLKPYCKFNMKKNIASAAFGAKLISATNEHYGPAVQVISAFQPLDMFDGLESARSRKLGHFEEAVIELVEVSSIKQIILNFQYFVNNNPKEIEIFGLGVNGNWITLVEKNNVKAFAGNKKSYLIQNQQVISKIKIKTIPDGGINRVEVYE
jgi:allantoicase